MASTPYQKTGNTIFITANSAIGTGNITVANASNSFSGINGPLFLKVDNVDTANIAFINFGPNANAANVSIANATSSGTGICIQPKSTEIIEVQVSGINNGIGTIFLKAASTAVANLYITPVLLAGDGS
jgi:hypothetical protein